jgi:septum formation protein
VDRDGIILEKPEDAQHAYAMLSSLSGRTHLVHSGVAIYSSKGPKSGDGIPLPVVSFCETSRVDFAPLSDEEIWNYIRCVTNPRLLGWNL